MNVDITDNPFHIRIYLYWIISVMRAPLMSMFILWLPLIQIQRTEYWSFIYGLQIILCNFERGLQFLFDIVVNRAMPNQNEPR